MPKRPPSDEAILAAVVELADDGFCNRRDLVAHFRGHGERDMRKSIGRSIRRGFLFERRAPDGRLFVALTEEGWRVHRSQAAATSGDASRSASAE